MKLVIKFIGVTAAIIGAIIVAWNFVTLFYLINGRIQSGWEHPLIPVVIGFIIFGLFFVGFGKYVQ